MRADDKNIQTPEEREAALKELAAHVFFQFCEKALSKPSKTFGGKSPVDHARQGIDEFRQIEDLWLKYERPDEELEPV